MGITGLLQNVKSVSEKTHLESLRGSRVAIDGYSWLHKGAYYHGKALCEGQFTDGYVNFFLSRIKLLLEYHIIPLVVFDGCRLPSKELEEASRRKSREENLAKARAFVKSGQPKLALEFYNRAVDISATMAKVVIEHLRDRHVKWVVAPYEADAQMAFLALQNCVDIVITEDSDLLAYGCPKVLFKLDKDGWGTLVQSQNLGRAKEITMLGWDAHMFLTMCIMSGCDFLNNIPGVGIKTAAQLVQKFRSFSNIIKDLRARRRPVPSNYEILFQRAVWVFRHQRVWDPDREELTHLRPLPVGGITAADVDVPAVVGLLTAAASDAAAAAICETNFGPLNPSLAINLNEADIPGGNTAAVPTLSLPLSFLGPVLSPALAAGICRGDIDPATMKPFNLLSVFKGWKKNAPSLVRALLPDPSRALGGMAELYEMNDAVDAAAEPFSMAGFMGQKRVSGAGIVAPMDGLEIENVPHHHHYRHHHHHHHGHHGHHHGRHLSRHGDDAQDAAFSRPGDGGDQNVPGAPGSEAGGMRSALVDDVFSLAFGSGGKRKGGELSSEKKTSETERSPLRPRKKPQQDNSAAPSAGSVEALKSFLNPQRGERGELSAAAADSTSMAEAALQHPVGVCGGGDAGGGGAVFGMFMNRSSSSMRIPATTTTAAPVEKKPLLTTAYGGDKARKAALEACRTKGRSSLASRRANILGEAPDTPDQASSLSLDTSSHAASTAAAAKPFVPPRMSREAGRREDRVTAMTTNHDDGKASAENHAAEAATEAAAVLLNGLENSCTSTNVTACDAPLDDIKGELVGEPIGLSVGVQQESLNIFARFSRGGRGGVLTRSKAKAIAVVVTPTPTAAAAVRAKK